MRSLIESLPGHALPDVEHEAERQAVPLVPPDVKLQRTFLSDKMKAGRVVHRDVLQEVYDDINKRFGSNAKVPE